MQISTKDWLNYVNLLSKLNDTAAEEMQEYVQKHGFTDTEGLIDYAYGLVTKYGEGSAALAAEMYDETARLSGKVLPPAEVADTASHKRVGDAIKNTLLRSVNPSSYGNTVSRLVKQAGADTTLKNAERDGAQFAWVPVGDTCAFCITLASRGFQNISKKAMKNGHAEHIHANCDCAYTVRFDKSSGVAGYDPDKYLDMYYDADGEKPKDKINAMRRMQYQDPAVRDKINAQKRAAYAERQKAKALDIIAEIGTIEYEKDILIPGNAGAMFKNTVITLPDGTEARLTPATRIEKVQVIAGKGRDRQIDAVDALAEKFPDTADSPEEWQKLKGIGHVDYDGESYTADIHWYRHPKTGNVDYKVKPDAAGNWFYED